MLMNELCRNSVALSHNVDWFDNAAVVIVFTIHSNFAIIDNILIPFSCNTLIMSIFIERICLSEKLAFYSCRAELRYTF